MLCKLAFRNVRKSIGDYAVYFLTLTFGIIVFYTFNSIDAQQAMMDLSASQKMDAQLMVAVMGYLSVFISFVLGFLILYANNFLIRRRKKELGIYMTLGMSKGKVSFVFIMETLLVGLFSLALGLLLGVLVSQGMSFLTAKLFEVNLQAYRFVFSPAALIKTVLYFGVIFLFVMVFNVFSISRHKLIDLIHASQQAERPRVRNLGLSLVLVVLGCACIGYAYYQVLSLGLMLSFASGMLAIELLLGCVGTVLLFTGGSGIALRPVSYTHLAWKRIISSARSHWMKSCSPPCADMPSCAFPATSPCKPKASTAPSIPMANGWNLSSAKFSSTLSSTRHPNRAVSESMRAGMRIPLCCPSPITAPVSRCKICRACLKKASPAITAASKTKKRPAWACTCAKPCAINSDTAFRFLPPGAREPRSGSPSHSVR